MRRNIISLSVLLTAWLLMGIALVIDRTPYHRPPVPEMPVDLSR